MNGNFLALAQQLNKPESQVVRALIHKIFAPTDETAGYPDTERLATAILLVKQEIYRYLENLNQMAAVTSVRGLNSNPIAVQNAIEEHIQKVQNEAGEEIEIYSTVLEKLLKVIEFSPTELSILRSILTLIRLNRAKRILSEG